MKESLKALVHINNEEQNSTIATAVSKTNNTQSRPLLNVRSSSSIQSVLSSSRNVSLSEDPFVTGIKDVMAAVHDEVGKLKLERTGKDRENESLK